VVVSLNAEVVGVTTPEALEKTFTKFEKPPLGKLELATAL
jgi:hypothetical protein